MSTTEARKGHVNSVAEAAAVQASIRGREGEISDLIYWHLIYWHVPVDDRHELAQCCWLRLLERSRPWDESKGSLGTWVRWNVLGALTHQRRRAMLEKMHTAPPVRDRDESIEHMNGRGAVGKASDKRPSIEDVVAAAETHALVREMMRANAGHEIGSRAWAAWHHDAEGLSCSEVVSLLARETRGRRSISRTRIRQIINEGRTQLLEWMRAHRLTLSPEDCHASLS